MIFALLCAFCLSFIAPFVFAKKNFGVALLSLGTAGLFLYFLSFLPPILNGETLIFDYYWAESLSINLSFVLDGLSLFFTLLISFFGLLIIIYSGYYLKHEEYQGRFYGYLIFFMGAMLGLVLSGNLISMFVFWELTSFSSYLLIGFHNKEEKSRNAARQALLVTGAGGLALLAGFILMGVAGGTYNIEQLIAGKELLLEHPYLTSMVILVLFGAFTKSAQFPFHFWLPNAMEAPTPVSAYLHSATMVKAGVYLVFRLNPVFSEAILWQPILTLFGATTMVIGAVIAYRADDLKRILAYTTISALGIFMMAIGIGTEEAVKGAMVYLVAHALYKGALFLATGILDHECGTRKISELSRIRKNMPWTAVVVAAACLPMAGMLPFLGFTGKELLYKAGQHYDQYYHILLVLLVFSSVLFVAIAIKVFFQVFVKDKHSSSSEAVSEASPLLFAPPLLMGVLGFFFGVFPDVFIQPLLQLSLGEITSLSENLDMSLWHGFNLVFILSLLTVFLGVVVYLFRTKIGEVFDKLKNPIERIPEAVYEKGIIKMTDFASFQTGVIQSGYLRNYISVYTVVLCFLIIWYFIESKLLNYTFLDYSWHDFLTYELIILVLVAVTLTFIFYATSRLSLVAAIGIIGYAIALGYNLFSAPDVAITQFLAETLSLMLLILITPKLPGLFTPGFEAKKKYLFISVGFGVLMAVVTLIGMSETGTSVLRDYFIENSIPKGKGENIVNVILVDFRALDTLGEISVLTVTMIGIIALLRINTKKERKNLKKDPPEVKL